MSEIEKFEGQVAMPSEVVRVNGELVTRADLRNAATDSWTSVLAEVGQLARGVCQTDFVPKDIRGNVGATSGRILYGREVGLGPMQALTQLHHVEGRVGMSAEAMRALVMQKGHEIAVQESTSHTCTMMGRRKGSEVWSRVTWTMDDAKRAKLDVKFNWRSYPRQMLVARATAELCRMVFPDVIHGLSAVEEFDDVMLVAGQPAPAAIASSEQPAPRKTVQRKPRQKAETAPAPEIPQPAAPPAPTAESAPAPDVPAPKAPAPKGGDAEPGEATASPPTPEPEQQAEEPSPEPVEDIEPAATKAQVTKLVTVFNKLGVSDRAERLYITGVLAGREVESANHLTKREANRAIDAIEQCTSGEELQQVVNQTAEHAEQQGGGDQDA